MAIGDDILKRARAHYEAVRSDLQTVDVPEWGEDGKPLVIYYRPANLREMARIQAKVAEGLIEGAVEMLLVRALDQDGNRLFRDVHKTELLNHCSAEVALRIVNAMHVDAPDVEDAQGN